MAFDRVNLWDISLDEVVAHGGQGQIRFARLLDGHSSSGPCNFVDLAVLPPGTSIGRHRHAADEEEFYLILEGRGVMTRDDATFAVRAGDFVRNPPGGVHELVNSEDVDLKVFVFEIEVMA